MSTNDNRIRIDLTPDQQRQLKEAVGHDVSTLEFSLEELEQRIAPSSVSFADITVMKPTDVGSAKLFWPGDASRSRRQQRRSRWIHDVTIRFLQSNEAPFHFEEARMSTKKEDQIVRIDLTQQQKDQVKTITDQNAEAIELTVKELEARITPYRMY
jgi:hypothetical protein